MRVMPLVTLFAMALLGCKKGDGAWLMSSEPPSKGKGKGKGIYLAFGEGDSAGLGLDVEIRKDLTFTGQFFAGREGGGFEVAPIQIFNQRPKAPKPAEGELPHLEPVALVEDLIDPAFAKLTPQDEVVLYTSGHGAPEDGFVALEASWVAYADRIANAKAKSLIVLAMHCHSGALVEALKKRDAEIRRQWQGRRLFVLTSSAADEISWGRGMGTDGSVFGARVREALQGLAAKNKDQGVSVNELASYVARTAAEETKDLEYGDKKSPQHAQHYLVGDGDSWKVRMGGVTPTPIEPRSLDRYNAAVAALRGAHKDLDVVKAQLDDLIAQQDRLAEEADSMMSLETKSRLLELEERIQKENAESYPELPMLELKELDPNQIQAELPKQKEKIVAAEKAFAAIMATDEGKNSDVYAEMDRIRERHLRETLTVEKWGQYHSLMKVIDTVSNAAHEKSKQLRAAFASVRTELDALIARTHEP